LTETLLVATDGSTSSRQAVDVGVRLARGRDARLTIVHSSHEIAAVLFERNPETLATRDEVASIDPVLRWALARAVESGIDAELTVLGEEGARAIAAAIVGTAEGVDATMIVIGARGRNAVTEAIVGSVSRLVMEMSNVPVVVVHAQKSS